MSTAGTVPAQTLTLPATSGGVLVVGNSIGINLGFTLDRAGLGVSIHSVAGCSMIPGELNISGGTAARTCGPLAQWAQAQQPQFVLLMELGVAGNATKITIDHVVIPVTSARYQQIYKTNLQQAIDALSVGGTTVIVPNLPCMGSNAEIPVAQQPQYNARLVEENALIHEVVTQPQNRGHVLSPDLRTFVCPRASTRLDSATSPTPVPTGRTSPRPEPTSSPAGCCSRCRPSPRLARAHLTLADDLFDQLHAADVFCTFASSGSTAEARYLAIATSAYSARPRASPRLGVLRVDRRPQQLTAAAAHVRAQTCATPTTSRRGNPRVAYYRRPIGCLHGTALPEVAKALATPIRYFTC